MTAVQFKYFEQRDVSLKTQCGSVSSYPPGIVLFLRVHSETGFLSHEVVFDQVIRDVFFLQEVLWHVFGQLVATRLWLKSIDRSVLIITCEML